VDRFILLDRSNEYQVQNQESGLLFHGNLAILCIAAVVEARRGVEQVEDVLGRVLNIETEAKAIVSEAQELAVLLQQQAEREAEEMRVRARQEAESEADALRERAEQEVQKERARILSDADRRLEGVQDTDHLEEAVAYIVAAILGQEEGHA
jgi:vacuolar-type H+-ATPase subunit H